MLTQNRLRKCEENFNFATAVDLNNNCLKPINLPILLYTSAQISDLPYNLSIMYLTEGLKKVKTRTNSDKPTKRQTDRETNIRGDRQTKRPT